MGAIIEAVHARRGRRWPARQGSISLAVRAARETLRRAGCEPRELDLLINTGVYRDRNISEPAMAPFIQRRIGASPSRPPAGETGLFSFDLTNGGCGFVNAIQIVDSLIQSGRVGRGMVVTSDVDPTPTVSRGLSFAPAGAALLLGAGSDGYGFTDFHFESFPKHAHLLSSGIHWIGPETPRWWHRSNHAVISREDTRYVQECVNCAERATGNFLARLGMKATDVDLVIPSLFPEDLPRAFAERMGLGEPRLVDVTAEFGPAYTAGPAAGLHAAMAGSRWASARTVLLVAVGAGIDVSLAMYRIPAGGQSQRPRA